MWTSPAVKQWVDAENTLTHGYLDKIPGRDAIKARMLELVNYERYTAPSVHGTRYFYNHNSGLQNQAVMFWQEGLAGEPKVLLDPNTLSKDGTVALNGLGITDDGAKLIAYAISGRRVGLADVEGPRYRHRQGPADTWWSGRSSRARAG